MFNKNTCLQEEAARYAYASYGDRIAAHSWNGSIYIFFNRTKTFFIASDVFGIVGHSNHPSDAGFCYHLYGQSSGYRSSFTEHVFTPYKCYVSWTISVLNLDNYTSVGPGIAFIVGSALCKYGAELNNSPNFEEV
jgi:hypothetical protein